MLKQLDKVIISFYFFICRKINFKAVIFRKKLIRSARKPFNVGKLGNYQIISQSCVFMLYFIVSSDTQSSELNSSSI